MLEEIKQLPMIKAITTASDYIVCKNITSFEEHIEWNGQTEEDKKSILQDCHSNITEIKYLNSGSLKEECSVKKTG